MEPSSAVLFRGLTGPLRVCAVHQSDGGQRYSQPKRALHAAAPEGDDEPPPVLVAGGGPPLVPGGAVAPLFELCLRLVAAWLDHLDSLEGFPELVGKQLVRRASLLGLFDRPDERCVRALTVAVSAYPDQVLPSLRIPDQLTFSQYEEPVAALWSGLTQLSLSGCRMGDCHPALAQIATLNRLTHLYLAGCALTRVGIRTLTLPARMTKAGLISLQQVDVRDNDLDKSSLLALCRLQPQEIAASVSINPETRSAISNRGYQEVPSICFKSVVTTGWLRDVVEQKWISASCQSSKRARMGEPSAASRFYGRPVARPPSTLARQPSFPPPIFLRRS